MSDRQPHARRATRRPVGEQGPTRQRVGGHIKQLRLAAGLSLNTLAEGAAISPSHLSRIERGLTVPSYDVLDRIADVVGTDLSELSHREKATRGVDAQLESTPTALGVSEPSLRDLLRLAPATRAALAAALCRIASPASAPPPHPEGPRPTRRRRPAAINLPG